MRKWSDQINTQRKIWRDSVRTSQRQDIRDDEFHFMQGQHLENPYQHQEEEEEDEIDGSTLQSYGNYPEYPIRRNDSSATLRSRSTTGESGPPMTKVAPRQFPMGAQAAVPSLQVRTNGHMSMEQNESFFSPATESPMSTRSSGIPSMYGYGRQQPPPIPGWQTMDDHRFTAPAMPRSQLNSMQAGTRIPQQRPSLPPSAHSTNTTVNRLRSASSPDIANPVRRYDPSQVPPMPDLPQFPANYAYQQQLPMGLNRSQSSSPASAMGGLPTRTSTQTPTGQSQRITMTRNNTTQPTYAQDHYQQSQQPRQYSANMDRYAQPEVRLPGGTPASLMPGPPPQIHDNMQQMAVSNPGSPTQLKVRIHYESAGSSMVLVVPVGISFQSLKDRIDAKLQRSTTVSLASGQIKLKYADEGDLVSILSDEDVQMAFETWRDSNKGSGSSSATVGEVELYIQ